MKVEHILAAVDFTDKDDKIIQAVKTFLPIFNPRVTLAHFIEPLATAIVDHCDDALDLQRLRLKKMSKPLADVASRLQVPPQRQVLQEMTPKIGITKFAKTNQVDLIILSTHPHHGFADTLLGSTAHFVLNHAECPTLIVK